MYNLMIKPWKKWERLSWCFSNSFSTLGCWQVPGRSLHPLSHHCDVEFSRQNYNEYNDHTLVKKSKNSYHDIFWLLQYNRLLISTGKGSAPSMAPTVLILVCSVATVLWEVLLPCFYSFVTVLSQCCYSFVTVVSQCCYSYVWVCTVDGDHNSYSGKQRCFCIVTVLLQCCHSVVTVLLQCCYSVVTVLLQCCYSVVILFLQWFYSLVKVWLQLCVGLHRRWRPLFYFWYTVLQCGYSVVTVWLQCCYSVVTVLLQCCHSVVTVLLQCCYSVVILFLQCCYSEGWICTFDGAQFF
jgi:hypothetical protein